MLDKKRILISQPVPANGSPYADITSKYGIQFDFNPFFKVEPVTVRDFRAQRVNVLDYTAIIFTSKTAVDAFFKICEEIRVTIPETMKYFCQSEAIAHYLQKYIVYRKRKIFFGNGTSSSIIDSIGAKHKNEKFLITCTDSLKPEPKRAFTKAKLNFGSAVLVNTVFADIKSIDFSQYGMVVFYSPSDVRSLKENFPEFEQKDLLIATYGNGTARAVKEAGLNIEVVAPTPQAPSIAQALSIYLSEK